MAQKYIEFEAFVVGAEPKVWRRFLLRESATFEDLHHAVQDAGSWEDYHFYQFLEPKRRGARIARHPQDDADLGDDAPAADRLKLGAFFQRKGKRCWYNYDFGDDWIVEVRYLGTAEMDEAIRRRLTGGERAWPPEDCGGIWGYCRCAAAAGAGGEEADQCDPEELDEIREWMGDWHPDRFDLAACAKRFNH